MNRSDLGWGERERPSPPPSKPRLTADDDRMLDIAIGEYDQWMRSLLSVSEKAECRKEFEAWITLGWTIDIYHDYKAQKAVIQKLAAGLKKYGKETNWNELPNMGSPCWFTGEFGPGQTARALLEETKEWVE